MEFVQIEEGDTHLVFSIYKSCIEQHAQAGFYQWDKTYPSLNTVETDIKKKHLFGLKHNGSIIAVVAITDDEPKEYHELTWQFKASYVVVHRLCVAKQHLRKGIAKKLMQMVETYAKQEKYQSIRLDTFSLNKAALRFYKNLNYNEVGKVNFPKRTDSDYTCFEKEV